MVCVITFTRGLLVVGGGAGKRFQENQQYTPGNHADV